MNKRGFTLIELLIYITLAAMVMLSAGKMLKTFLDYQSFMQTGRPQYGKTALRANNELKQLVKPATGFSILDSGTKLRISSLDGTYTDIYLNSGRLVKQKEGTEAIFITGSEAIFDSINFFEHHSVLQVDYSIAGGEYTNRMFYFPRN